MLPKSKKNLHGDFPKDCSYCRTSYSEEDWEKLSYRGIQRGSTAAQDLEMRCCGGCGAVLAVPVPSYDMIRHEPPTPRMFSAARVVVNKDSEQ